ncbi:MAG: cobalt ECF transporter T component CbiQ [Gemmataceae bacterium]|nr:cobalt ECF transporter T component CbiQ [Gemmataceae bacterium]
MTLALEQLPTPASPLRQWDPRWKLAALVLAALTVATLQTLPAACLALVGAGVLAVVGRLPWPWFLARLGSLALVLLLFVGLLPFWMRADGPGWDLGPLHLSLAGLRAGLLLCLKALTVVAFMLVLLATAPLPDTLKAAHALRVPGLIVQLTMLTYRYVFVLAAELARLRVALRVRGYRNRATRHSYRTVGHVAGTLLVRGSERAERVGQAMRCRGFDGRFRSLAEFRTTGADVGIFAVILLGAVSLRIWDWVQR